MIAADVYVGNDLVGHFSKRDDGVVEFAYLTSAEKPVASALPIAGGPYVAAGGALPPFFTNLLPEGRRLSTLKRTVKASLDDELALLLAVGGDTIGNVSVLPHGQRPSPTTAVIDLDDELDFSGALALAGVVDPIAVPGVQDKASARTIAAPASMLRTRRKSWDCTRAENMTLRWRMLPGLSSASVPHPSSRPARLPFRRRLHG